ncbi:alpha/beta fold hydrolase [Algibacter luteus]|uniref:alpha/beta fold hydrolase n=1 Tax=Algibacter luteus TaxID=1178825 RepID=UPI0025958355|nr:alpha/beta hydrolase [Algibacter luteus]WJJ96507.1 alpha/beta hydrolase [Algibacter luteus]WJJ96587.1 alpha/beta hydrolase [Algibacter luteus]
MPKFTTNKVTISYEVHGKGKPIVLLHGGAVDFNYNYVQTGWIETLTENGFQVIGINFRGYGESDKSNDPNFYGTTNFSNDVINLIKHLDLNNVCLIGYSMGTLIAFDLLSKHPEYFSKAVLMATGDGLIGVPPYILENLLPGFAKVFSYDSFPNHLPKHVSAYWNFLNEVGLDRESMIAMSLGKYSTLTAENAAKIEVPTLIISGEMDLVLGKGQKVAQTLPNGEYLEIKGANHFELATERKAHKSVIKFLIKN